MKVTIETIINRTKALEALAQKDLSIATAYRVTKLIQAAQKELEIYNSMRVKVLEDVGATLDEGSNEYEIPADKRSEFAEKFAELISVEVELPDKVDLSKENVQISPDLLLGLDPFITFDLPE